MNTQVQNANESLHGYCGGEQLFVNPVTKLQYTEGVKEIAKSSDSYWFLDIIASYQKRLKEEGFQVWKLEREYSFTTVNDQKFIDERKDSFNVVCEDGNERNLIKQHISFSDFPFDEYTVWCVDGVVLLPVEY